MKDNYSNDIYAYPRQYKRDGTPMTWMESFESACIEARPLPKLPNPSHEKFSTRYGSMHGRCNAKTKKGGCCKRYPLRGRARCKRHGAGWYGLLGHSVRKLKNNL